MRVNGGRKEENLARADQGITEAARAGGQVVLLPEAFPLGWMHPFAASGTEPIPDGDSCRRLSAWSRWHSLYVCAGLVERAGAKVFNAAVLLGPTGELLLHHRKINELGIGHDYYALGDRLQVAATSLGTFGLMVCADAFCPRADPRPATGVDGCGHDSLALCLGRACRPRQPAGAVRPVVARQVRAGGGGFPPVDRRANNVGWVAQALVLRRMQAEKAWSHDAFFDYVDRWMYENDAAFVKTIREATGRDHDKEWSRQGQAWDAFVNEMWFVHRKKLAASTEGWKQTHDDAYYRAAIGKSPK